jgi:glycosyltransferase involved in cell wall biosynthesis
MRVAFVNPVGTVGGAERCLLDVLASLREGCPEVDAFLIALGDGPLVAQARAQGVPVEVCPLAASAASLGDAALSGTRSVLAPARLGLKGLAASPAILLGLHRLSRALHAIRPDRVVSNGAKAHALAALARPRGASLYWYLHDYVSARRVMRRALGALSSRASGAVAVSRSVADDARAVFGPRFPIGLVRNAVDLDRFAPGPGDGATLDDLAGLPRVDEGTVRVGLVATYARWKGHEVFLRAASRLIDHMARFYIVGGPIYATGGSQFSLDELRALSRSLGLGDRVGFIPFQADPVPIYRSLDVMVHASTRPEPFGLTIAEAMACGRAVVVSAGGGAAELFEPGVSAVGVRPGDPDALSAAIRALIEGPGRRERLGREAREAARAHFDRSRLGPELAACLGISRGLR